MSEQWRITWHDSGREPQVAPNPASPEGIDIDMSGGAVPRCTTALPYPARRCGAYIVECQRCGFRGAVTTAGRPDDPRSVTVPCLPPPPKEGR
jgi:hypothetical protein